MRAAAAIAAIAAAALLLSGCSTTGDGSDGGEAWAAAIRATSDEASSNFERKVLEDGKITDAEYSELQTRILDCLSGLRLKGEFDADGSLTYTSIDPTPVDRDAVRTCNADNGIRTLTLRDAMVRNPARLDEGTIMVDCLRRVQLVDSSYTAEMYDRGVDLDRLGASPLFDSCDADPLHFEK